MTLKELFNTIKRKDLVLQIKYNEPDYWIEARKAGGDTRSFRLIHEKELEMDIHPELLIAESIADVIELIP